MSSNSGLRPGRGDSTCRTDLRHLNEPTAFPAGSAVSLRIPAATFQTQTQTVRGYPAPDQRRVLRASEDAPDEGLTREPSTRRPVSAGDRLVAAQPSVRTGAGHTRKGDLSEYHPNRAPRQAAAHYRGCNRGHCRLGHPAQPDRVGPYGRGRPPRVTALSPPSCWCTERGPTPAAGTASSSACRLTVTPCTRRRTRSRAWPTTRPTWRTSCTASPVPSCWWGTPTAGPLSPTPPPATRRSKPSST